MISTLSDMHIAFSNVLVELKPEMFQQMKCSLYFYFSLYKIEMKCVNGLRLWLVKQSFLAFGRYKRRRYKFILGNFLHVEISEGSSKLAIGNLDVSSMKLTPSFPSHSQKLDSKYGFYFYFIFLLYLRSHSLLLYSTGLPNFIETVYLVLLKKYNSQRLLVLNFQNLDS